MLLAAIVVGPVATTVAKADTWRGTAAARVVEAVILEAEACATPAGEADTWQGTVLAELEEDVADPAITVERWGILQGNVKA